MHGKDKSRNNGWCIENKREVFINDAATEYQHYLGNNAFYAVNERRQHNPNGYDPTIWITTTEEDGKVEIKIKDNGNGLPQRILDKIFQPFFTTKPTGQGTGLVLSLAYDLVKAHGGEIKVEAKDGKGSEFIIRLSFKSNNLSNE